MMDPRAVDGPVTVRAVTYHTINHTDAYEADDEYTVDDPALFETLYAIGFVDYVPDVAQPAEAT